MEETMIKDCSMNEKTNEGEKVDEVLLPGFRFHPTDEELVGFYLKRKIQQRPLSIELIKQLDIYKFDPWDLPKFASAGEKEWYFYCPRDRKYRNSARPNRVTGAGFWKATGTDRPIYSSEGNKCIGLKKSLVFYQGRAAKGVKTDWMMHEFRLPSLGDATLTKRCVDKNLPVNDSWAICRIFKKTGPITSRTHTHSWVSPSPDPTHPKLTSRLHPSSSCNNPNFSPDNMINTSCSSPMQQPNSSNINELDQFLESPNNYSSFLDQIPTFKPIYPTTSNYNADETIISNDSNLFANIATLLDFPPCYTLPQLEDPSDPSNKSNNIDISSMLLNMSSSVLGNFDKHSNGNVEFGMVPNINGPCHDFSLVTLSQEHMQLVNIEDERIHEYCGDDQQDFACTLLGNLNSMLYADDNGHQWDGIETIGSIPISDLLPPLAMPETWKSPSSLIWDCAPPLS
ncbi:putative NAC domain-containing protein 94 [Chenopodium quinoa]|uniref:NAC domain-containing protein n=1 Tax=Chenopodium quinoa TaxID=63459 RepID=A0A803NE26_CHEQI|nr:putative NAC domain-containing protein 94 [Chenopodium quinoa]